MKFYDYSCPVLLMLMLMLMLMPSLVTNRLKTEGGDLLIDDLDA